MYSEVIINSNARALNRVFDYIVPEKMESSIKIGSRVFVPFGNTKKLEDGFVIGLKENSEFANKEIAYYAINKGVYQESKQSEFTEILMNKWWEYQNTPNTKKQTTFECTSSGCRTIKCIGDKCEIEE